MMQRSARTLAYIVSLTVTYGMTAVVPASSQQPAPATATVVSTLMKQAITELPGRDVIMITLDIPPGGSSPPHRHPGHHIFGYVLEGTYKLKLDQGPETLLTKGQTFHEAPGQLHAVSGNGSQTEPAKVLAFIVAESGKPITVPEKQ